MEISIKNATKSDLKKILSIQHSAFKDVAKFYKVREQDLPPLCETLQDLDSQFQDHIILKALADDRIIGTVRGKMKQDGFWIERLAVHPEYQNSGIGKSLMLHIENQAQTTTFKLFTGSKDPKTIHLYESLGYKTYESRKESEKITLIFMKKHI
ncbi:MAG: GNAT family N-acetyltransferase [Spirochaetia bacterium]